MQPQDNNIPQDQSMGGGQGAADPMAGQSTPMGGSTFQPQTNPSSDNQPVMPQWHGEAAADAQELYAQPTQEANGDNPAAAMPPNPLLNENPAPQPDANAAMTQEFNQASNLTAPLAPNPEPTPPATPAPPAPGMEAQTAAMPTNPLLNESAQQPQPAPATPGMLPPEMPTSQPSPAPAVAPEPIPAPVAEPAVPLPPDMSQAPAQAQLYQQPSNLPGADQLGMAAAGMDQGMPNQGGIDPRLAQAADMGAYGPPPRNNKKILFVILGVVIGIVLIVGIVFFVTNSSKNKQTTQNLTPTTQQPTQTPSSGPATPPENYVTVDKQCYTFALYNPNTVPTDQACSFEEATFGKLKTSTISVITTTESLKAVDDYFSLVKPNVTVVSEESLKLDKIDAKQLIYKASDGKTYSEVAALIVGKNYQQDGKPVTAISIKTSYQGAFDQEVNKNVIDTWRWK